jgi:uncharacterized membrane protein YeaQ/YmgE (transglycosylase-associated protein family)
VILAIIIGCLAGFLAGKILNGSGYGILMDLLLGFVGGIFGRFVFGLLGIGATGIIGAILISTAGAMMLIWTVRWMKSSRGAY